MKNPNEDIALHAGILGLVLSAASLGPGALTIAAIYLVGYLTNELTRRGP